MQYFHPSGHCCNCHSITPQRSISYTIFRLGYVLCESCQEQLEQKLLQTTEETILLYFALRARHLPVDLQSINGHNRIDIIWASAGIYIKTGGSHEEIRLTDTGLTTLSIPPSQVKKALGAIAEYIQNIAAETAVHHVD
jgi:hypothetical protein